MTMPARKRAAGDSIEVEAFLADSIVSPDGKLYTQGAGWNVINTLMLPFRQARLGVGAILRVPYQLATSEAHLFEIRLEDEDGHEVAMADAPPGTSTPDGKIRRVGGQFTVGRPPGLAPGDEQLVPIALNVDGLEFKQKGVFRFVISIDGVDRKYLRFRINHVVQPGVTVS
jgi:hypothetical protein